MSTDNKMALNEHRCGWAMKDPAEQRYHDEEWGKPIYDDRILFEFITLEGAQAGLSWRTILNRRDAYQQAFDNYDLNVLAQYSDEHVDEVIRDFNVVKHRGKIASVFSNARAALGLIEEYGSLKQALWQFVEQTPNINHWQAMDEVPVATDESKAMSRFLKKRGFKFVGETICYAFMQATGMVNDHIETCPYKYQSK